MKRQRRAVPRGATLVGSFPVTMALSFIGASLRHALHTRHLKAMPREGPLENFDRAVWQRSRDELRY